MASALARSAGTYRSVSKAEGRLLTELARRQQRTVSLRGDRELLASLSKRPRELLSLMARKGTLVSLGGGRYVVASWAGDSLAHAAPFPVLLDAALRERGPYYLGFLSALIDHRLTDVDSWEVYVALGPGTKFSGTGLTVDGRPVHVTRVTAQRRWEGAAEQVRAAPREHYSRSTLERTLADTMYRTRLCGGMELVMSCWARGLAEQRVEIEALCGHARALSAAVARRVGFTLTLMGFHDDATRYLGDLSGPRDTALLDTTHGFGSDGPWSRDSEWGIRVNVPERTLAGWAGQPT